MHIGGGSSHTGSTTHKLLHSEAPLLDVLSGCRLIFIYFFVYVAALAPYGHFCKVLSYIMTYSCTLYLYMQFCTFYEFSNALYIHTCIHLYALYVDALQVF